MNKTEQPSYRLPYDERKIVCDYLDLVAREQAGSLLTQREHKLAQRVQKVLTATELRYLCGYYLEQRTQRRIAEREHRNPATVTRGILRAQQRLLEWAEHLSNDKA